MKLSRPDVIVFDFDGTLYNLNCDWNKLSTIGRYNLESRAVKNRRLKKQTIDIIRQLQNDYYIAILSLNLTSTITTIISNSKLYNIPILGRDVTPHKPNAEGLKRLSTYYRTNKLVMVGDSYNDVQTSKNFGCPSIIVDNKNHHYRPQNADKYIKTLNELTTIF